MCIDEFIFVASQQSVEPKSPQLMVNPEAFLDSSELDDSDTLFG